MLFALIGGFAMRLHFTFFKQCAMSPFGAETSLLFNLCGPESKLGKTMEALRALLSPNASWGFRNPSSGHLLGGPVSGRRAPLPALNC